jgi:hypothetical protein
MWKSKYTNGEKCRCGDDAIAKVGEEILHDDPFPNRHNLTAYVCEKHFRELFGDFGVDFMEEARNNKNRMEIMESIVKCPMCGKV